MRYPGLLLSVLASVAVTSSAFSGSQPESAAARPATGDLCTGGQASGIGLRGAYYSADPRTVPPSLIRVDSRIGSSAVRALPAASSQPRSVRWCGWVRPIASGAHRFQSAARDMRIEVANQRVAGLGHTVSPAIELEAGKLYSILIEVPDVSAAGEFSLQWTQPFGATLEVPPTVLFPPVETAVPGC